MSVARPPEPDGAGRRPGRPAGTGGTRATVLAAARTEFATRGYDAASVRAIARQAGVDPALVHHYYGSKERVFVAAMQLPFDPADRLPAVLEGDRSELGERLTRLFLELWGGPGLEPMLALLRSATTGERGAAMLREYVGQALLLRIAGGIDGPGAELRVTVAAAQLVGLALLRFVVGVEPLASAAVEDLVALVAPTLQRYLVPG